MKEVNIKPTPEREIERLKAENAMLKIIAETNKRRADDVTILRQMTNEMISELKKFCDTHDTIDEEMYAILRDVVNNIR